jgi:hypothetical protein
MVTYRKTQRKKTMKEINEWMLDNKIEKREDRGQKEN